MIAPEALLADCELALGRSTLYGVTARLLTGPAGALDPALFAELARAAREHPGYTAVADDAEAAARLAADPALTPRVLEQEFTHLFRRARAAPYEGSYLPAARASQELADVAGFLRAFGTTSRQEKPDHVVSELEFMALLCLKESIARGNGQAPEAAVCRDAQAKFLKDHLGRWLVAFHAAVVASSRFPLYPAIAQAASHLVAADAVVLGVEPGILGGSSPEEPEDAPKCGVGG